MCLPRNNRSNTTSGQKVRAETKQILKAIGLDLKDLVFSWGRLSRYHFEAKKWSSRIKRTIFDDWKAWPLGLPKLLEHPVSISPSKTHTGRGLTKQNLNTEVMKDWSHAAVR